MIMIQIKQYDNIGHGKRSKDVLTDSFKTLYDLLNKVYSRAVQPNNLPEIPPEIIDYVDEGRNPDIYNREFVELARKSNQILKGKREAYGSFTDILAQEMLKTSPELRGDIERVLGMTGRDKKILDQT
jgi:mediator of RNA polymerase II transcription subunit 10